jgi:Serine carboxypeptidase S28
MFLLLCCMICLSLVPHPASASLHLPLPAPSGFYSVEAQTLTQTLTIDMPIDHFNDRDTRTYKNRYWMNDTYYQPGGPIFFFDRGEGAVTEQYVIAVLGENGSLMAPLRLAERFNGMAVAWEHRFYGNSLPFPLDNETGLALEGYDAYKYLSNEQALEDTVYFANNFSPPGHDDVDRLSPVQTPWIWVGASYSGARGAMVRLRNPETFYAAWAMSAPVEAQVDMSVYYNPIQQSMPTNCSADVHAAVTYADEILLNGSLDEVSTLQRAMLIASNPKFSLNASDADLRGAVSDWDHYSMALDLSTVFGLSGIYFQSENYAGSLSTLCDYLEPWNPANATKVGHNMTGTQWLENTADLDFTAGGIAASFGAEQAFYAFLSTTLYLYQDNLGNESHTSPEVNSSPQPGHPPRSWTWQYCSEFGYLPVANMSDPTNMISRFRNVTSMFQNHCKDVFPFAPNLPDVGAILKYGGHNMAPSNTMFTDGEWDPWRT